MRIRKHHGCGRHRLAVALVAALALLVTVAAGAAFAGYRYDRARAGRLLPGVRIAGIDVGGMTRAQAERALQPTVRGILDRPIRIAAGHHAWTSTAGDLGTSVDVRGALDQAFAASSSYGWPQRTMHRLLGHPVGVRIALAVAHDGAPIAAMAGRIADQVSSSPRDASLAVAGGKVQAVTSRAGHALDRKAAISKLARAVEAGATTVRLPMRTVHPKVTEDSLGLTIVVRISENRLYLYDGIKLDRTYPVATGQPQYPTPTGHFEVITKEVNPTWHNPARDTWGKDEPAEIAPGPGNPLGTRAMALTAPGILIHGTYADSSIGTHASHGCIRMHIQDSEALFNIVTVGTPVIIVL